ncbi:MAG: hypothetical protein J4G19_08665, partial [Pseudomonadales bacterium]|nr:hypothetical protein [Pseudomonadales bacterium]
EPCDSVIDLARNADMMLCMCGNDDAIKEHNRHNYGQTGTISAARMAQSANVKTLVLIHMGHHITQHGPLEKALGDIRQHYSGQVIFSEELMELDV